MNLLVFLVLLVMGFEVENQTVGGFGYELLIGKMELLEQKLDKFQNDSFHKSTRVLYLRVEIVDGACLSCCDADCWVVLGEYFGDSLGESWDVRNRSEDLIVLHCGCFWPGQDTNTILQEKLQNETIQHQTELLDQNSKMLEILTKAYNRIDPIIASCDEAAESGRYKLNVSHQIFEVYCEQKLYGGGWIVIQNRYDGSVDFFRNWTEYRNGFGRLEGEFWLGLQPIHLLTSSRNFELMVHLEDFDGVVKYAKYNKFAVGSETEQYVLKTAQSYSGTAGNSLPPEGFKFSTYDRDNDGSTGKCAEYRKGAWWYSNCSFGNLNGNHQNAENGMFWYSFNYTWKGLKVTKMMIRET